MIVCSGFSVCEAVAVVFLGVGRVEWGAVLLAWLMVDGCWVGLCVRKIGRSLYQSAYRTSYSHDPVFPLLA